MSDSLWPHGLYSPWSSPGQNTGVEWLAVPFSKGSSQPRDRTQVSRVAGRFFTNSATREAQLGGSVQFSRSVVSNSLRPHRRQHAKPPCPSPAPRVYSNSCPLSLWCHPTISSFVAPFSSHLQSFPESGSFQISLFFTSGGQSVGASASASVLPMKIQGWFSLGWTGWMSLQSKGLSTVFYNTTVQKHQFFSAQLSLYSSSHIHTWLLEKTIALTIRTFVGKVISLLFSMLSRLVITFLPRSTRFLISWLQSPSAVILEPKKIKSATVSTVSPLVACKYLF